MLVRSLHRYGPKAVTGWIPRPGRGRPTNPWLVAPAAQCYKEWVGTTARSTRFTAPPLHPTPQTLTDRGSTGAAGSSATAAAASLLVDPAHPVPPPDARPHRQRSSRPRARTATSTSSRRRPCDPDTTDGLRLRAPLEPRWSATPVFPLFSLVVVLGVVDLDLGG
jgi:hypothetical protein